MALKGNRLFQVVATTLLLGAVIGFGCTTPAGAAPKSVVAFGANGCGQLGNGTTTDSATSVSVLGVNRVKSVAGGGSHSLALLTSGSVLAWGCNSSGQLGNGTTNRSVVPVPVPGLGNVKAVAARVDESLALLRDGTVEAWGDNSFGQLGDGATSNSSVPVPVMGLKGVRAIAAGGPQNLALLRNGTVMAWGANYGGDLGVGSTATRISVPMAVPTLHGVKAIASEGDSSLALLRNGTVLAWGSNSVGELGNGTTTDSAALVAVQGLHNVKAIFAGDAFAFALLSNGTTMAWGYNASGTLGIGTITQDSLVPVPVPGLKGMRTLSSNGVDTLAILANGTVVGWGDTGEGRLGIATSQNLIPSPSAVPGLIKVKAIGAGSSHTLVVT
jgi:alpha-tubulin suppressor-like RCC1 family protein